MRKPTKEYISKDKLEVLTFSREKLPEPYQNTNQSEEKMVSYGYDNYYPYFLLDLYANSPIHASIVNAKATYIIGDGVKLRSGKTVDSKVNPSDTFTDFVGKLVKDYLIFNYFAVEVIYNALNQPIQYHYVPAHCIRTNKSKTKFWFNEDWKLSKNTIVYDRWKANNSDETSKIFYFDGYFPSPNSVYPMPEYNGSLQSIKTDIAIRDFNYNNIRNHFSVSTLITFFNGANVTDEVAQQKLDSIKKNYTGENGNKLLLDFQSSNGKAAEVQNLTPGDWDKAYVETLKNVADDIYRGHQVTSPMLLGVKTEGQLGGATEMETAYEIFKNTYIRGKRAELIAALNLLFTGSDLVAEELQFTDKPLFNTGLSETLKEKVYTINELRKEAGLQPLPNGDRLLADPIEKEEPTQPIEEDLKKNSKGNLKELSDDDFDKVSHFGLHKDDFEIVQNGRYVFSKEEADLFQMEFDLEQDVSQWLVGNNINGQDLDTIVKGLSEAGLNVTVDELKPILTKLNESGLVKVEVKDNKVNIQQDTKTELPNSDEVFVMYDYVKRIEASGPDLLPTSRGFCKKLINNNKYYSMEDIQSMSTIFGYSVFQYGGGFWHNEVTDKTTSHCRHRFKSVVVKRKKK